MITAGAAAGTRSGPDSGQSLSRSARSGASQQRRWVSRQPRQGWLVPHADDGFGRIVGAWFAHVDDFLFGRTTYDMMQAYWTEITEPDNPVATALNGLPSAGADCCGRSSWE